MLRDGPFVLYGGNFDPVHVGHVALARHLLREGAEVCLLASVNPPFRDAPKADVQTRKAMLTLALSGESRVCVASVGDFCESPYTIDLLRKVRKLVGSEASLAWAMGADQYAKLNTWREWTELTNLAHLVVFRRAGDIDDVHAQVEQRWQVSRAGIDDLCASPAGKVAKITQQLPRVSSTEIRSRLACGEAVDRLLPPLVLDYIVKHRLYQTEH